MEVCATCHWAGMEDSPDWRYCRFKAPVAQEFHTLPDGTAIATSKWPRVHPDDYCSQYRPDMSSKAVNA